MEILKVHSLFFSATFTTKRIIKEIVQQIGITNEEYDITKTFPEKPVKLGKNDLLIVGIPVYSGRVPSAALKGLNQFKGNKTPAIIVCVYGNRNYDDAVLELQDIVENNGFIVISAAAFIARHSIFPQVATDRPDDMDYSKIKEFCTSSMNILSSCENADLLSGLHVKGNRPYRQPKEIPIHPVGNKLCNECGTCVKLCPTHAIPSDNPKKTDKSQCISCGRCIVVCPQKARNFKGILYRVVNWKFKKDNAERKEPEFFFTQEKIV